MKTNKFNIPINKDNKTYIYNSIDHFKYEYKYKDYKRIISTLTGIRLIKYYNETNTKNIL